MIALAITQGVTWSDQTENGRLVIIEKQEKFKKWIRIIKDFLNIFIPFMSSITANVVPRADKTAAVQQISPMQDGK